MLVTIPDRAVATEKDLDGTKGPPQHLVQPIRKVNGRRSLEGRPLRHTVDGPPTSTMHLEPCQDVLCNGPINPTQLHIGVKKKTQTYKIEAENLNK